LRRESVRQARGLPQNSTPCNTVPTLRTRRRSLVEAASLAVVLGLAVLDCGPRVQAGFISVATHVSPVTREVDDFAVTTGASSAASDVPSFEPPANECPAPDFHSPGPEEGAASPSPTAPGGPSASAFVGLSQPGGLDA